MKLLSPLTGLVLATLSLGLFANNVKATDYSYQSIVKRNPAGKMTQTQVAQAKVQAQCLVGIKKLNFKRKDSFDPISEWTSFRTAALLERYSPCEVLIMLEVVQTELRKELKA